MAKIQLTLHPQYVRDWKVWEALRELLQNGLDAHDDGFPLTVTRGGGKSCTLRITNTGTTLSRETLLMGGTSKDGTGARGQFGEGYKLAMLVLARGGHAVRIRTGYETWTPSIVKSDTFGGADVLEIDVRKQAKFCNHVEVQLDYLDDSSWELVRSRILCLPDEPATEGRVGDGLLTAAKHKGLLYVRGLYVCKLPDDYAYGYDLANVTLDRDRRVPQQWDLRSSISGVLNAAARDNLLTDAQLYALAESTGGEATALKDQYAWSTPALSKAVAAEYKRRYSDAVPVKSSGESMEASEIGLDAIIVSEALTTLLMGQVPTLATRKAERTFDVTRTYSDSELSVRERGALGQAVTLIRAARPDVEFTYSVVDYVCPTTDGQCEYMTGRITIDRRQLASYSNALGTMAHEVAHIISAGPDHGSMAFINALTDMLADIATGEWA